MNKHNTFVNPLSKPCLCFSVSFLSVPRNPSGNTVLDIDFDIELGNTADEAKDDPGKQNTFDRDNQQEPRSLSLNDDGRAAFTVTKMKLTIISRSAAAEGEGITVTRCVLIGPSPGGDT